MKTKSILTGLMTTVVLLSVAMPVLASADEITSDSSPQVTTTIPSFDTDTNQAISEDIVDSASSATFDYQNLPSTGEIQTITADDGTITNYSMTPVINPLLRVANGKYKINAWGVAWNVTFYINVSSNKITSANNLDYIIAGSVGSHTLTVDSSKQATARFDFTTPIYNIISWTGWVRATINSSNKIVITNN
ncbi:DUF5626 family protein [Lactococcus nasutitermitis]|uniref:DUF5626 family protein n=2 Tax=Lactococcus nasutitermitis TaxID=1652957 RepID=A0ABV9JIN8_9LACT